MPTEKSVLLSYVLSGTSSDERPYLEVQVFGIKILGLLDSGASRTILGQSGWDLLCKLNLKLSTVSSPSVVTVANGEQCSCLGTVSVPVSLCGKVKVIDMLIIPSIPQQLILGVDFLKSMDVVPHLHSNCWKFGSESIAVTNT